MDVNYFVDPAVVVGLTIIIFVVISELWVLAVQSDTRKLEDFIKKSKMMLRRQDHGLQREAYALSNCLKNMHRIIRCQRQMVHYQNQKLGQKPKIKNM